VYSTCKIDDGTGEVEVKQWSVNDPNVNDEMDTGGRSAAPRSQLELNGYVRVFGRIRIFNKLHVNAHLIRPLIDLNEVHYHLLEATAVHLYFTRGPPPNAQGATRGQKTGIAGAQQTSANTTISGRTLPPLSPLALKLYQTLSDTPQSNEGLHVQLLAARMSLPVAEVYKASEELLSNGLIFTTVDDNTWAILEF